MSRHDRPSLDRRITDLLRLSESEPTPELFLELGQLCLRGDDLDRALAAFTQGLETTRGVVLDLASGEVELDSLREELRAEVNQAAALLAVRDQTLERQRLLGALEGADLTPEEHDALIRIEVELGLSIHAEEAACPACSGPLTQTPDCPVGSVRCARTGQEGDLCRHVDATNMYACSTCGQVLRAWLARRPRVLDPHEAPMVRPERTRCPHCNGRVADWTQHYNSCPQAPPGHFPRCDVCRQRGFHRRPLHCPRCTSLVGETLCAERRRR